jgi:cellulose 1,4-beta-cellobiosidase
MVTRSPGSGRLWFLVAAAMPAIACEPSSQSVPPPATVAGPATSAATPSNPFAGAQFYVDPAFAAEVESVATQMPDKGARLRGAAHFPTAIWLNSIASAQTAGQKLDEAARQQQASGQPVLTVFVLYNLPNRDCAAESSSGELSVEQNGEARYEKEFVDVAAAAFRAHPSQRIAAILEPDSLANVVTNLSKPKCAASEAVYRSAIAYAVRALSIPNVSVYLDAAHAGWLGWDGNRRGAAKVFADVLARAGSGARLRGFSINVSNYDPLVAAGGGRAGAGNPCPDELTYAQKLAQSLGEVGVHDVAFIVDTSRNGRADLKAQPGSWCNVRGAGIGERPRAAPAPGIDAYYWVKPPGESDGTSDPKAPRYDASCSSPDSAPSAPQAGVFFPSYFADLVANANPGF